MTRWRSRFPVLAAALLAVPCVVWTCIATQHASFEPLGRDQGIFQYVGWALSRGSRDYVDVHDINGPLVPLIHLLFLKLGGADEHVFRWLDLLLFGSGALLFGAALPGVGDRAGESPARASVAARVMWALAAWVVLSAGYFLFDWWSHAQRESFFDDLIVPSIGLQLWAHRPGTSPRHRRVLFAIAGALGALTWFGKPSCVVYSAIQALAIVADDELPGAALAHLRAFCMGALAACLPMLGLLAVYGDLTACARIMLFDVWRLHRYIWHKSLLESYSAWNNGPKINYVLATFALASLGIATRVLPRRMIAVVALLAGGAANFVLQGKGFPYHLQSAVIGVHLLWVASAACFAERVARAPGDARLTGAVSVGLALLAYQATTETLLSPAASPDWYDDRRSAGPESEAFLRHFTGGDYFALDLHRAAAYLRSETPTAARVQTYGMDPYVLFMAQRLSATPYIYNFELNVDSALEGHPGSADRAWMIATAEEDAHDLFERVRREPPGAFVTMDLVPYTFPKDGDEDFAAHCPEAAAWMRQHYRLSERFGTVRVWLPDDAATLPTPTGRSG
jgi:hypothetical protein